MQHSQGAQRYYGGGGYSGGSHNRLPEFENRGMIIDGEFYPLKLNNATTILNYLIERCKATVKIYFDDRSTTLNFTLFCFGEKIHSNAYSKHRGDKDNEVRLFALYDLDRKHPFLTERGKSTDEGKGGQPGPKEGEEGKHGSETESNLIDQEPKEGEVQSHLRVENWEELLLTYLVNNEQVLVTGPTGCGKSSLVPPLIMREFPESTVLLIQPRRLAATELASYIRRQNSLRDEDVGIMMGFTNMWNPGNRLVVATAGSVINMLLGSKKPPFDWVILDEIHELSQDIEMCFALLQRAKEINLWKFKLICMSATVNPKILDRFHAAHFVLGSGVNSNYTIIERVSRNSVHDFGYSSGPSYRGGSGGPWRRPYGDRDPRANVRDTDHNDDNQEEEGSIQQQHMKQEIDVKSQNALLKVAYLEILSIIYSRNYRELLINFFQNIGENKDLGIKRRVTMFRKSVAALLKERNKSEKEPTDIEITTYLKDNNITTDQEISIGSIEIDSLKQYMDDPTGDILVFLPGMYLLKSLRAKLTKSFPKTNYAIYLLHSSINSETRLMAISTPVEEPFKGKIFISTNIAETSLTIPTVTHVLDSCLSNKMIKVNDQTILKTIGSSQNEMLQRRGRIGRTGNGVYTVLTDLKNVRKLSQNSVHEIYEQGFADYLVRLSGSLTFGLPIFVMNNTISPLDPLQLLTSYVRLKEMGGLTYSSMERIKDLLEKYEEDKDKDNSLIVKNPIFAMSPSSLMKPVSQFGSLDGGLICTFGFFLGVPFTSILKSVLEKGVLEYEKDEQAYKKMMAITSLDAVRHHIGSIVALKKRRKVLDPLNDRSIDKPQGWIRWMKDLAGEIDKNKSGFVKEVETCKNINFYNVPVETTVVEEEQPATLPQFIVSYDGTIPTGGSSPKFIPTPIVYTQLNQIRALCVWAYSVPMPTPYPSPIEKKLSSVLTIDPAKARSGNLEAVSNRGRLAALGVVSGVTGAEAFLKSYDIETNVKNLASYIVKGSRYNFSNETERALIEEQRREGCVLGAAREECVYGADEVRFRSGVADMFGASCLVLFVNNKPSFNSDDQLININLNTFEDKLIGTTKDFSKVLGEKALIQDPTNNVAPVFKHRGCLSLYVALDNLGLPESDVDYFAKTITKMEPCKMALSLSPEEFRKFYVSSKKRGTNKKPVYDPEITFFIMVCHLPLFVKRFNDCVKAGLAGSTEIVLDDSFKSRQIDLTVQVCDEVFMCCFFIKRVLQFVETLELLMPHIKRHLEVSTGYSVKWCRANSAVGRFVSVVVPFGNEYKTELVSTGTSFGTKSTTNGSNGMYGMNEEQEDYEDRFLIEGININEDDFDSEIESDDEEENNEDINGEGDAVRTQQGENGGTTKNTAKSELKIIRPLGKDEDTQLTHKLLEQCEELETSSPRTRPLILTKSDSEGSSESLFSIRINKLLMDVTGIEEETKLKVVPYSHDHRLWAAYISRFRVSNTLIPLTQKDLKSFKLNLNPETSSVIVDTNEMDVNQLLLSKISLAFVTSYRMSPSGRADPKDFSLFNSGANTLPILWALLRNMYSGVEVFYEMSEMEKMLNTKVRKSGTNTNTCDGLDTTIYDPNQLFRLPNKQISRANMKGKIHLVLWNGMDSTGKDKYSLSSVRGNADAAKAGKAGKQGNRRAERTYISIVTDETESERRYVLGLVDRLALIFRTLECILIDFSDLEEEPDVPPEERKTTDGRHQPTLSHDWRLLDEEEVPCAKDDMFYDPIDIYNDVDKWLRVQGKRTRENLSDCLVRYIKELCFYSDKCPERLGSFKGYESEDTIIGRLLVGVGNPSVMNRANFKAPPTSMMPMRLLQCSPKEWRADESE